MSTSLSPTSRERVLAALAHRVTDRVPRLLYEEAIGYTPSVRRLLQAHCAPREPRDYFGMDITRVTFNPTNLPVAFCPGPSMSSPSDNADVPVAWL